ncbi:MAG: hypothetical protein ABH860_06145 [bacterium]
MFFAARSYPALQTIGISESIAPENRPMMMEMYRIRITNAAGGTIEVSENKGQAWTTLGHVILPTKYVSDQGYTASKWIDDGNTAAAAVNAIHIKTDYNLKDDKGVIFSLVPKEYYSDDPTKRASQEAAVYTDIKAGHSLFGGGYSPFVGNKVLTYDAAGNLYPINSGYIPKISDVLVIIVERPVRYPKEIVFENRFGGLITIKYLDGEKRYIGQVLRPVEGVGRFLGSEYADVGRIRANHAGVICVATSPLGQIGGFQIIPAGHGMSKEMITARTLTQWMVIGPVNALDPSFEGMAPFFKYFLQPRYSENDIEYPDWKKRLLERFLVEVKYKDKEGWQTMPVHYMTLNRSLPRWAGTAMENVSHIRILFPMYTEGRT